MSFPMGLREILRAQRARHHFAVFCVVGCVCMTGTFFPTRSASAQQTQAVSMELVLAVDSSASVDDREYELQIRGISDALRRPEIISIILQYSDGVAISVAHFGGWADSVLDPPWRLLSSQADILSLADELDALKRRSVGSLTALGHAIDVSVELIETNAFEGRQRKIDISGDGRNNSGRSPDVARLEALARGISINGLVILTDDAGLFEYYDSNVAVGPARFVMKIENYEDYAIAIARKLKRELAPPIAEGPVRLRAPGVRGASATEHVR